MSLLRSSQANKWILYPIAVLAITGIPIQLRGEIETSDLDEREQASAIIIRTIRGNIRSDDAVVLRSRTVRDQLV